jgi:hypothetical protein
MKPYVPAVLALALVAAACGDNTSSGSSTTAPSTTIAETFAGGVDVGGTSFNRFTVSQPGQVSAVLTAAGPPSTIVMGLGLGTPSESSCAILPGASTKTAAGAAAQLTGMVSAGAMCVQVYDVGNQTDPITYSVTVTHP